jgi:protein SDA1
MVWKDSGCGPPRVTVFLFFYSMGGFGKRNRLTSNLPQLQNLIKRDPSSYKADFEMQLQHFNSSFELFALQPNQPPEDFGDLCTFITQVSTCFPTETKNIPTMFMTVLRDKADFIEGEMRRTLVQCLILLRNRSVVSSQEYTPKRVVDVL